MKKFLIILAVILMAYLLSYYTVGAQKGYKLFDFDVARFFNTITQKIDNKNADDYAIFYDNGITEFENANFNAALEIFLQLEQDYQDSIDIKLYIGRCHTNLGNYYEATDVFNNILTLNPDYDLAYFYNAYNYYEIDYYQDAINNYLTYLDYVPDDYAAHYNLGISYIEQYQYDIAILEFNEALKYKPDYELAYFQRGRAYINSEQYKLAIEDYRYLITLTPDDNYALFNLGLAFYNDDKFDSAKIYLKKCIELDTNYNRPYHTLAQIYQQENNNDKALEFFNKALEISPDYVSSLNARGDLYRKLNKFEEALADYRTVFSYDATNLYAAYYEAFCWKQLANNQEAIKALDLYFANATETHELYADATKMRNELSTK